MSASTTDPQSPTKLPSLNEALDISITTDPLDCTISVLYPSGVWDVVYQDGTFAQAYSASTRTGSAFSLRRAGGWPPGVSFQPKVKETTPAAVAALQPLLSGALAAWALQGRDPAILADRSGNSQTLTSRGTVISEPDLIPGQLAPQFWSNIHSSATPGFYRADSSLVRYGQDFTIIGRAYRSVVAPQSNIGLVFCENGSYRAQWGLYRTSTLTGDELSSRVGLSSADIHATVPLPDGYFTWMLRRNAAMTTVSIATDTNIDTSTSAPVPPSVDGSETVYISATHNAANWFGGLADVVVYNRLLSDAEYLAQRKIMLGL